MGISVITTIKNEENNIREFLDSLLHQTRHPDEIIITDGGSTDNTCEIIQKEYISKYPHIKLIQEKCNIAKGRNLAIGAASQDIIAVTDAGCKVDNNWLGNLTGPLESDKTIDVCGGITIPDSENNFEKTVGGFVYITPEEMRRNPLLISSRNIAFRKSIWEKVGGYPEWLYLTGEDTLFDKKLKDSGAKIQIVPEAKVYWKPRENFRKFFSQAFGYARGNGQAGLYVTLIIKTFLVYLLFLILLVAGFFKPLLWLVLGILLILYFSYSAVKMSKRLKDPNLFFTTILLKFVIDIANLLGYPVGVFLRLSGNAST